MVEPGLYTLSRLAQIADAALGHAGVLGAVPTPLDAVAHAAGVEVMPVAALGRADLPVLGALWFEERTLFLERRQSPARRRFTQAHELMHALCPWHRDVLRTDTAAELFGPARVAVEAEANAGAGLLIFGGSRFGAERPSLPRALVLAAAHEASVHATLVHSVRSDSGRSALLVAGRFPQRDGSLPVWRSIRSRAFGRARLPTALSAGSPLRVLVEQARTTREPPPVAVRIGGRAFTAEAHDNRHAMLVLLTG